MYGERYDHAVVTIEKLSIQREARVVIRSADHTDRTYIWWDPVMGSGNDEPIGKPDVDAPDEDVIIENAKYVES